MDALQPRLVTHDLDIGSIAWGIGATQVVSREAQRLLPFYGPLVAEGSEETAANGDPRTRGAAVMRLACPKRCKVQGPRGIQKDDWPLFARNWEWIT